MRKLAKHNFNLKTKTDKYGKYSFPSFPNDMYELHVHKLGYSCKNIKIASGEEGSRQIILEKRENAKATLEGKVINDQREPLNKVRIYINDYFTMTNEKGEYKINADPGTHQIRILVPGEDDDHRYPAFTEFITIDDDYKIYNPVIPSTWSVSGYVFDEEGNTTNDLKVFHTDRGMDVDKEGEYLWTGIFPGRHYFYTQSDNHYPCIELIDVVNHTNHDFVVTKYKDGDKKIHIISGTVRNMKDEVPGNLQIRLLQKINQQEIELDKIDCDSYGNFCFGNIKETTKPEEGKYILQTSCEGYEDKRLEVQVTTQSQIEDNIIIIGSTKPIIQGTVMGSEFLPIPAVKCTLDNKNVTVTDSNGFFNFETTNEKHTVTFTHNKYQTQSKTNNGKDANYSVFLDPKNKDTIEILGEVTDDLNKIDGAEVKLYEEDTLITTTETNNLGEYVLTNVKNNKNYTLKISKSSYFPIAREVAIDTTDLVKNFEITPKEKGIIFKVNVNDEFKKHLSYKELFVSFTVDGITTNKSWSEGSFKYHIPPDRPFGFTVECENYAPYTKEYKDGLKEDTVTEINLLSHIIHCLKIQARTDKGEPTSMSYSVEDNEDMHGTINDEKKFILPQGDWKFKFESAGKKTVEKIINLTKDMTEIITLEENILEKIK